MKRRHIALGAVGLAAAVAGLAWQRRQSANEAAALSPGVKALWQARFERPEGGPPLEMASWRGKPLVLNFWGSWCPPCVKEMPELARFHQAFAPRGWQVLGLAVDNPRAVRDFLAKNPVSYTIGLAGFEGSELTRLLGNDKGGLPFTAMFDRHGALKHTKAGETSFEELAAWARAG